MRRAVWLLFLAACGASTSSESPATSSDAATPRGDDASAPATGDDASAASGDDASPSIDAAPIDSGGTVGPSGLVHPGVLVTKAQLDFVKAQIAAKAEPWSTAFAKAKASDYAKPWSQVLAAPAAKGGPIANVVCGSFSNPDVSCTAEKYDASAAYTSALLWYFTGDATYAQSAIANLNAWAAVLTTHSDSNAVLQSGWVGSVIARAAEILRWTNAGWSASDVATYEAMLKTAYVPFVDKGAPTENGNWELSTTEALIAIGVFLDDASMVQKAAAMWRARVPAYIYLTKDGATPILPPGGHYTNATITQFWYGQSQLSDGLCQETCRDLGHVQYGFAAMINAAETARIQGIDLYGAERDRIVAGLEVHAGFLDGDAVPSTLCKGTLNAVAPDPMWEIAKTEYADRLGGALPNVTALVAKIRPTGVDHHMDWETLTSGDVGKSGL